MFVKRHRAIYRPSERGSTLATVSTAHAYECCVVKREWNPIPLSVLVMNGDPQVLQTLQIGMSRRAYIRVCAMGGDFCWLINGQWTVNTFKSLTLRLLMPYIYNISSLRVNEYLKNSECCSLLRCYLPSFIFYFIFFRENCATMVFSRIKISSFYVILLNWTRATSYYFRIFENPFLGRGWGGF